MNYKIAISLAESKLNKLNPEAVAKRTGVLWDGSTYLIPWFGENRPLVSGKEAEQVLWLHYLTSEGTRMPTGEWVAYRALAGAGFYEPKFLERAVKPLVKHFRREPASLLAAGKALRGIPATAGDYAITLYLLPYLPITYVLWAGDDELPPEGNILFDRTASGWLAAEDLTVLASMGTYRLVAVINT